MKKKKNVMESITDFALKISEPLGRFANTDIIFSIVSGLTAAMPIIMIGSIFLIFYVLGSPDVGTSGKALIPLLSPYASKFTWLNQATLGLMSLYCSISISYSYAERKNISPKSASLMGITTFILFTINGLDSEGKILVNSFSASGLFAAIITSIVSISILKWCIDHNITIKMPSSVPPNVGMAFSSLIPYAISFTLAWIIRTVLEFDFVSFLNTILEPVISGSDSIWTAIILTFFVLVFWAVGLHGDNMLLSLFSPFGLMWMDQNAAALSSGVPANELPNVLAGLGNTGLLRLSIWTAAVWPLIFLMIISKNKFLKTLGLTTVGPGLFTIIEPVIYGLPIALNPFLMVPFVLSGTVATGVGYLLMASPFMGKFYALVPWATPPFILGPLGTGDWKTVLIPIISFIIGLIIYLPFWKLYVQSLDAKTEPLAE